MVASLLALSILVQIVQEFYKYLFKSKSVAYRKVLFDLIGSQAGALWYAPETADFRVRGPWDFFRRKPGGILLPLGKEELGRALTRTAPAWVTRLMQQIEQEKAGRAEGGVSDSWKAFLMRLGDTDRGAVGYWIAGEIAGLLKEFGHTWEKQEDRIGEVTAPDTVDFAKLEVAARQKFLPHVEKAKSDFPLIERNMEYAYKRRSMRQTFLIALVVALLMNFPVQRIYDLATTLTDEQAVAMAEQATNIYAEQAELDSTSSGQDCLRVERQVKTMDKLYKLLTRRLGVTDSTDSASTDSTATGQGTQWGDIIQAPILTSAFWVKEPPKWPGYLLGCFITAVLLSFGAPFWNDIAKSVLNLKKSMASAPSSTGTTSTGNRPEGQVK